MCSLPVKLHSANAKAPMRASDGAAGYDLYSAVNIILPPHDLQRVPTDISLAIPYGYYGQIFSRSGLTVKSKVTAEAGVIDSDYRGRVDVVLLNHSSIPVSISQGDRIGQLILLRILTPVVTVIPDDEDLPSTSRGSGGFGSTGN